MSVVKEPISVEAGEKSVSTGCVPSARESARQTIPAGRGSATSIVRKPRPASNRMRIEHLTAYELADKVSS